MSQERAHIGTSVYTYLIIFIDCVAVVQKYSQALYYQISIYNVVRLLFRNREQIFADQPATDELIPD